MSGSVIFAEDVQVPLDLRSLEEFRRWALSDDFPERGRIDYIDGRIEVDMSPEEVFSHGSPKIDLIIALGVRIRQKKLGWLFSDCMRVSSPEAKLSAEPDIIYVSRESLAAGRVQLVPKATGEAGRFVELEGSPDLVVEILSDSSLAKDTRRLPAAYFAAGVREFWLVDERPKKRLFRIHARGESAFTPVDVDDDGFQRSEVMQCSYRLDVEPDDLGYPEYTLLEKPF